MAHPQQVISTTYPYLSVRITLRSQVYDAAALVDTGFSGDVVIPDGVHAASLGSPDSWVEWEVADGALVHAPLYSGTVEIKGFPPVRAAITILSDEYMLGRGVIDHFQVTFDHGQRLIVEP